MGNIATETESMEQRGWPVFPQCWSASPVLSERSASVKRANPKQESASGSIGTVEGSVLNCLVVYWSFVILRSLQFLDLHWPGSLGGTNQVNVVDRFTAGAGRAWRAILGALTTPPAESINRKDAPYLVLILASLAVGLAASWQCWGNPLVDHGRELNVPLRLARGEMLYSDVGYLYGPLSPYLNTLLYGIFRPSLWVLWGHGIVSTMIILALVYWLARQIAGRLEATMTCLAVTWVCALKPQGTYILAYAYSGLDGSTLVLATTALLVIFLRKQSIGWLLVAGMVASLAVLAKTEMGGAAVGTGLVAAAVAGYPRIRAMALWNVAFLAAALSIPALVYAWLASQVGWRTLTVENHLFFGHLPWQWLYFYGLRFGFDHPWHSLGLMILSLGRLIAFGGLLASVSFLLGRKRADLGDERGSADRKPARAVAMLLISLAGIIVTGIGLSDLGPLMAMPFLLLALAGAGIVAFVRAKRHGTLAMQIHAGTVV